jgi:hypothetical protein
MHETKKLFSLFIIGFFLGCLGQAPTPKETPKPVPTESPSPSPTITAVPSTSPPTVVPTTLPPVTVKPTGTPGPEKVVYYGNLGNVTNPEALELLKRFEKETMDNDDNDRYYYDYLRSLIEKYNPTGGIYHLDQPGNKSKLDEKALKFLNLNEATIKEILKYRDVTINNNTNFVAVLGKDYGFISFAPTGSDYYLQNPDEHAILNISKCSIYSKGKCEPITFNLGKGAWGYIAPREWVEKLINYLKHQP